MEIQAFRSRIIIRKNSGPDKANKIFELSLYGREFTCSGVIFENSLTGGEESEFFANNISQRDGKVITLLRE